MSQQVLDVDGAPQLLDAVQLQRALTRLAHEIVERHPDGERLVVAGIRTRGIPLAQRLARVVASFAPAPTVGAIDARPYRDDRPRSANHERALSGCDGSDAPRIDEATVVVVDDVLFTGRTVRAALDALMHEGRPAAVEVLALIDRGHRELPMRATYVGKNVPTAADERVCVRLREIDGFDGAWLLRGSTA
ncbi:MAG: bifunctional pyr operon transcriptional regulator/uracil phosphoribosyltransferase PyrR [Candidatus Dormibacteraeota bacterium]|nr:bifunctional pyr operon transcriptional regulator/uracil phosphoribosyltransferase PyrR [Candidatus Dormibacteraeota bacterium]